MTANSTIAIPAPATEPATNAGLAQEPASAPSAHASAKLRTVRGDDGWRCYLIEDGDPGEGLAIIERYFPEDPPDLLVAGWRRSSGEAEATVLTVEPYGRAFSSSFLDRIQTALARAAVQQLASWGIDALRVD